jgi:hypothetical protein
LLLLAFAGCKKDDPAPALQQHDTVYAFDRLYWYDSLHENANIKASADSAEVRHVILRATGDWSNRNKLVCGALVQERLKPLFEYSAKMQGEGRLNFFSTEPADSLWLVQHGYEVPAPAPVLEVSPAACTATFAAGTYSLSITSNLVWTATVNPAATWCTLSVATSPSGGNVVLSVAGNAATVARAATVTIAAGALTAQVGVTQGVAYIINEVNNVPTHAASSYVWQFGSSTLTWSDAIHIPDCNKETFESSTVTPQCRSYADSESGKTFYYYNWPYVDANKATLCPDPWRVPIEDDFDALVDVSTYSALADAWGCGGFAYGSSMNYVSTGADYWSSTEYGSGNAYSLNYYSSGLGVSDNRMYYGFQVRCVK